MIDLKFLAEEWPTISRRLDEALLVAPRERNSWLDTLHETDSIKAKLRNLLSDAEGVETDDFLGSLPRLTLGIDPNADKTADGAVPGAVIGALIGPYRLIRELGTGGMGAVWLAERIDGGLKRQVALKLPRMSWSRGLAERMSRERDILASLTIRTLPAFTMPAWMNRGVPTLRWNMWRARRLMLTARTKTHPSASVCN